RLGSLVVPVRVRVRTLGLRRLRVANGRRLRIVGLHPRCVFSGLFRLRLWNALRSRGRVRSIGRGRIFLGVRDVLGSGVGIFVRIFILLGIGVVLRPFLPLGVGVRPGPLILLGVGIALRPLIRLLRVG